MAFIYDMVDEWNNGAATFTAIKMNVTDTASDAASLLMDLQVGGTSQFKVSKAGDITVNDKIYYGLGTAVFTEYIDAQTFAIGVNSTEKFRYAADFLNMNNSIGFRFWSDASGFGNVLTTIVPEAVGVIAQRNSTNAQTFRVYGTFTDASNYVRGSFAFDTASGVADMQSAGTGNAQQWLFRVQGQDMIAFNRATGNNVSYQNFIFGTDNTYDIGASGANRPRDIYAAGGINTGSTIVAGGLLRAVGGGLILDGTVRLNAASDGVLTLTDNANTSFGLLQFGGTTSSFPALKRNSAVLETKLADDSAYAQHKAAFFGLVDGVTAPTTTSGTTFIYVDTADGDLKVRFGDGFTAVIAADS